MVLLQQIFLHFGENDFPFKIPLKECFKIVVFPLWRRDPVLEPQFVQLLCVILLWNGCVEVPRRRGCEYYCLLQLRVVNRNVVAAGRFRMVLWQQIFLHFGASCVADSLCCV